MKSEPSTHRRLNQTAPTLSWAFSPGHSNSEKPAAPSHLRQVTPSSEFPPSCNECEDVINGAESRDVAELLLSVPGNSLDLDGTQANGWISFVQ